MTKIQVPSEITVDPIFVLRKLWYHCKDCEYQWQDPDGYDVTDEDRSDWEPPCSVHSPLCPFGDVYDRIQSEHAINVFLTREEAENYGESQSHNFGKKNEGWDVWCIPAKGELAKYLNTIREINYDK